MTSSTNRSAVLLSPNEGRAYPMGRISIRQALQPRLSLAPVHTDKS